MATKGKLNGILVPLLLTIIAGMIGFGGRSVLNKLDENTKALNSLRITLSTHHQRIKTIEKNDDIQNTDIKKNSKDIEYNKIEIIKLKKTK